MTPNPFTVRIKFTATADVPAEVAEALIGLSEGEPTDDPRAGIEYTQHVAVSDEWIYYLRASGRWERE